MEAFLCQTDQGLIKSIRHRQRGQSMQEKVFCLSSDPEEVHDVCGRLFPETEAQLRATVGFYCGQPALVPHTTWRYLGMPDLLEC